MRVAFEYTADEQVAEVLEHTLGSARAHTKMRRDLFMTSICMGILIYLLIPEPTPGRAFITVAGIILWAFLYPRIWRWAATRRIGKYVRAALPGPGPFTCQVELVPEGVRIIHPNAESLFPWSDLIGVASRDEGVDMAMSDGGSILVRRRAFTSPGDESRFIEQAEEHIGAARAGEEKTSEAPSR